MKPRYIIGAVIIIAFFTLAYFSFDTSQIEYANLKTAKETGKTVQLVCTWVKDMHYDYNGEKNIFDFHVKDENNEITRVIYNGPMPNNFDMAEMVVLKGKYDNGVFRAVHILTKCPSKYESGYKEAEDGHKGI